MAKNQRTIGILMSYVSVAIGLVTTLLYIPLVNKIIGLPAHGAYAWALSIIRYLSLFQLGLFTSFTRFYTRIKERKDERGLAELNGLFLCLYLIIAAICFLCGIILVKSVGNIISLPKDIEPSQLGYIRHLMYIMVLNIVIDLPTNVFVSNTIVRERYFFARLCNIVKQVFNPLVGIPLLLLGFGSASLVYATTAVTVIYLVMNVWYCMTKIKIKFAFAWPKISFLKEIGTFSFFIFITMLVDQINWSLDRILLGALATSLEVGFYTNADQLSQYFFSFASTISDVFTPKVHRIVAANKENAMEELTDLFIQIGRIQFMLLTLITIGFISVGKVFIYYYADGYIEPYYVAIILFFSCYISAIQYLGIPILQAKNMHRFKALLNLSVVILNILISIPLCMWLGALGASIGTFLSNIFINGLVINWYYQTKVGLDIPRFWRNIIDLSKGLVVPIIFMFVMVFVVRPGSILMMLVGGVMVVVVYAFSMYKWGINQQEKEVCDNVISKVVGLIKR